jgi:hypothetical protein
MHSFFRIGLILFLSLIGVSACGGSSGGSDPVNPPPPPPTADTNLDWDDGNWDEENWQ